MKKAAVLISLLFAVCSISACNTTDVSNDTSSITFDSAIEITSSNAESESDSDMSSVTEKEESKKEESKKDVSEKDESEKEESSKDESKKDESKGSGRDDVIPSRSDEYEATPNTESKKPKKKSTDTDTATDTATDTDSDTATDSASDTDTEEKPEPPYLSGLWIVEKILDSNGCEVDGRDIYGSVFNYAGVLNLNEEGEFELTIGIIPEGKVNNGLYEQRGDVLVLQYDDPNLTQTFLDVVTVDETEMLTLPVFYAGKNYTIYFSR